MAVLLRADKGSALTHPELDENFSTLLASDTAHESRLDAAEAAIVVNEDAIALLDDPLTIFTMGFEDYNDLATATTPIELTLADTRYALTNDGAGPFTNTTYRLPGYNAIWDVATDAFDFAGAGLVLGDTVDIRIDIDIDNSGANGSFILGMDLAIGSGGPYNLAIDEQAYKSAGVHKKVAMFSIYMGDTNTLNFPAKLTLESDTTGDEVRVHGWYVRVIPRHAVHA
jgi:hypothetical protein